MISIRPATITPVPVTAGEARLAVPAVDHRGARRENNVIAMIRTSDAGEELSTSTESGTRVMKNSEEK